MDRSLCASFASIFRARHLIAAPEPQIVDQGPMESRKTAHARILSGSFILLLGSGIATATNFAYNVAVARFLGPSGYGHATAVYTLLILISAGTLSFQIVSAKLIARQDTEEKKRAVYRGLHRGAWSCGLVAAAIFSLYRTPIASYLKLPTPMLVTWVAVGAAFYVPLGIQRGYIQGVCKFPLLAVNVVVEGVVRLGGSVLLMRMGFGVTGVIAANAGGVAAAYLEAMPWRRVARVANPVLFQEGLREIGQAMIFFAGQVLINNCDIILVKHFFQPVDAGLYSAVALVGRVIYVLSFAVVNTMFPIVAGTTREERRGFRVIATPCLLVLGIGGSLAGMLYFTPAWVWMRFFGSGFQLSGPHGLPGLLALYAVTSTIYCLSVVVITYEMAHRIAGISWVPLLSSGVVIGGICLFHGSLIEVIRIQLILMIALFLLVATLFVVATLSDEGDTEEAAGAGPIRILRPVTQDEVIAEFLKNDFSSPAFHEYHQVLRELVMRPNLSDPAENMKRKALLFIRHLALWKELPSDTQWYEVELRPEELAGVRCFPRAHWRKLAQGDFSVPAVAERMRSGIDGAEPMLRGKLDAIANRISSGDPEMGVIVLIGLNEREPVTVLDGNHRLMAAMLSAPEDLERLRFLCGLSPRMSECCWYNTNLVTLTRYAKNVLTHLIHDPEAELARLMESAG
jgi:O-antigen/teichoic acid export membrane protein